jgi:hypothetical protein
MGGEEMKALFRFMAVLVFAVGLGSSAQEMVTVFHGVVPAVPTFAPDGPYTGSATSVTVATVSGTAYYCTGASDCDPTGGTLVSGTIAINSSIHLCSLSTKTGFANTTTHCGTYTISTASPIARTGSCAASGTSCTLSAVNTGDLVLCGAYRNGSTTAPGIPGSNTNITTAATSATGTTGAERLWCRKASSGSDTGSGTSSNATTVACVAYSGTNVNVTADCNTTGIGGFGTNQAKTSATIDYPALTLNVTDGSSWVAGFAGDSAASPTLSSAFTQQATTSSTPGMVVGDSNAGVVSWADSTQSVTSGTWLSGVAEVIGQRVATPAPSIYPGYWYNTQTVGLSTTTPGAAIHYTTDGSTPNCSSATYSSALTVSSTQTVKAVGCKSGYASSAAMSAYYHIGTYGLIQCGYAIATSSTAVTYNLTATGTANRKLVGFVTSSNGGTLTAGNITDNGSTHNTWVVDQTSQPGGTGANSNWLISATGANSVTSVTVSGLTGGTLDGAVCEFAGMNTGAIDQSANTDDTYNGGLAWSLGPTGTTTQATELVFGGVNATYPVNYLSTLGTGYFDTTCASPCLMNQGTYMEYAFVNATGAQTATGTLVQGSGQYWMHGVVGTYKTQ